MCFLYVFVDFELSKDKNKDTLFIEVYKAIEGEELEKEMLYKDFIIEQPANSNIPLCPSIVLNKQEFRLYNYNENNELLGRSYVFPSFSQDL